LFPRRISEEAEPKYLVPDAAKSTDAALIQRAHQPYKKCRFRTEYERDYTRIVHSRAFRRLRHKTQVFIHPSNDHVCTRLEHSLHVASVARTISKALGLNNDLVAAIAIGHDLGHAPFGHHGETCLAKIVKTYRLDFKHEIHSLRIVDHLDSPYRKHPGLNLTFAVRDGIASHWGEGFEPELVPNRKKRPQDLMRAQRGALPATLEGCVVRMADKVAYLGRDLEDAIDAGGIVRRNDLPPLVKRYLGRTNGQIIGSLIGDIYDNSKGKGSIKVSTEVADALNEFNEFNKSRIYAHQYVKRYFGHIDACMKLMFDRVKKLIEQAQQDGDLRGLTADTEQKCPLVLAAFLKEDVWEWQKEKPARLALDFVAGMTDPFFISCFEEQFLPRSTV
jgi:dGTPase